MFGSSSLKPHEGRNAALNWQEPAYTHVHYNDKETVISLCVYKMVKVFEVSGQKNSSIGVMVYLSNSFLNSYS